MSVLMNIFNLNFFIGMENKKNNLKKRIVFFGTKGWDLTNRHLDFF